MANYKHFGVMLDVSRNAVMKVDQLKNFIDVIVKLGYNTLELYAEDTYEVEGEQYLGYLRGRYTASEIREIDRYCQQKNVELIPCIQTLAHFTNTCKLPHYNDLFDCHDILFVDEPKTYEFIENVFKSLSKNFTSRLVNIGMDEAHFVGLGKYLNKHGYKNRVEILLNHLNKVCNIAKKYGFVPHMWSDMFFRLVNNGDYYGENVVFDEQTKNKIPKNVELTYWDYYNAKDEILDSMFKAHINTDRTVWFAGGCWCWNGFEPNNEVSLITMAQSLKYARKYGVENILMTMWGDNGKECSFYALLPSLYAARKFADGVEDMEIIKKGFKDIVGYSFDHFTALDCKQDTLLNDEGQPRINTVAKSSLYNDVFLGILDYSLKSKPQIDFEEKVKNLKLIAKNMGEYKYLFENSIALNKVLSKKCYLGIKTREAYQSGDKKLLKKLIADYTFVEKALCKFRRTFYNLWMKENKPFGWEIHEIRLAGLKARICECKARIKDYLKGKIDKIEELEEKILPFFVEEEKYFTGINSYTRLISPSEI